MSIPRRCKQLVCLWLLVILVAVQGAAAAGHDHANAPDDNHCTLCLLPLVAAADDPAVAAVPWTPRTVTTATTSRPQPYRCPRHDYASRAPPIFS